MEKFTYSLEDTKSGFKTIIISRDGKEFPLHSRIDPLREAEKNRPELDPVRRDLLIALGCGMGYHLEELASIAEKFTRIIIIDIIPDLNSQAASSPAAVLAVRGENVIFLTGMDIKDAERELERLIHLDACRGIQVVEHLQSFRLFPEYYEALKKSIKSIIDRKSGNCVTVKAFGNIFLRNALNNIRTQKKLLPVNALNDKFRGSRALIVSSAPSAEDYLEGIRKYRDRFYLIAVDSALPMLEAYGIKPDFAISIDPQHRISEHFMGHHGNGTAHIFSIVSPPSVVERYGGFISLNTHPVSQIIEELFPGFTGSIDSGTGSVAGDAINFALLAGFDSVAMTGFDFSFSRNIIYARETSYQKRYSLYFNSRVLTPESFNAAYIFRGSGSLVVEGRYTRRSFTGYRDSLIRFIDERCGTPPVIINRTGLKLRNGVYGGLEDFTAGADFTGDRYSYIKRIEESSEGFTGIADHKKIISFIRKNNLEEELLKESLGKAEADSRDRRFLKLLGI